MIAYLDYNIFTSIEDGELTIDQIIKNVDPNINEFPYSHGHIQEVDNIVGKTEQERNHYIFKRLDTIRQITNCFYVYLEHSTKKIFLLNEDPKTVYETITEVPYAKSAMKLFANLFSAEQKKLIRQTIGIDIKQLNNYNPKQVVDHLNSKLLMWGSELSVIRLVEKSFSYHMEGKNFTLIHRIAAVMELLDMLGYWKDKTTETSNYARMWDSNHTFFASLFDYFITDDKRTRYKARVVYDIYNIKTKVVSSSGKE